MRLSEDVATRGARGLYVRSSDNAESVGLVSTARPTGPVWPLLDASLDLGREWSPG